MKYYNSLTLGTLKLVILFYFIISCNINHKKSEMEIQKSNFGLLPSGEEVNKYKLSNGKISIEIINYGGIITNINFQNSRGEKTDVVLGFDNIESYIEGHPYFGSIIGRYGNRIALGKFELNGNKYQLQTNNGENALHGGNKGFDKVIWSVDELQEANYVGLKLGYLSKHMEEGYPGNLNVTVTYLLTSNNELKIKYQATTDLPTIINLTQHSYFNLSGESSGDILDHQLSINADSFLPINKNLIPTGGYRSVDDTAFDFREFKRIGKDINSKDIQLNFGLGYDHCWILNDYGSGVRKIAEVKSDKSGIKLEVFTDQPGVQFYTGNFLDGSLKSKKNSTYKKRNGFCLETQHFPNSPNQKDYPSVTLLPNNNYNTETWYRFSN